jgi:hypothetical protein
MRPAALPALSKHEPKTGTTKRFLLKCEGKANRRVKHRSEAEYWKK